MNLLEIRTLEIVSSPGKPARFPHQPIRLCAIATILSTNAARYGGIKKISRKFVKIFSPSQYQAPPQAPLTVPLFDIRFSPQPEAAAPKPDTVNFSRKLRTPDSARKDSLRFHTADDNEDTLLAFFFPFPSGSIF